MGSWLFGGCLLASFMLDLCSSIPGGKYIYRLLMKVKATLILKIETLDSQLKKDPMMIPSRAFLAASTSIVCSSRRESSPSVLRTSNPCPTTIITYTHVPPSQFFLAVLRTALGFLGMELRTPTWVRAMATDDLDADAPASSPSLLSKLSEVIGLSSNSSSSVTHGSDCQLSLHAVFVSAAELAAAPFNLAPNATLLAARAVATAEATTLLGGALEEGRRELPWRQELLRAPGKDTTSALWWPFSAEVEATDVVAEPTGGEEAEGVHLVATDAGRVVAEAVAKALALRSDEWLDAGAFAEVLRKVEASGRAPADEGAARHAAGLKLDLSGLIARLQKSQAKAEQMPSFHSQIEATLLMDNTVEEIIDLADKNEASPLPEVESDEMDPAQGRCAESEAPTPPSTACKSEVSYAGVLLCVAHEERVVSWVEQLSTSVLSGVNASSSGLEKGKESLRAGWSASKRIGLSWCENELPLE